MSEEQLAGKTHFQRHLVVAGMALVLSLATIAVYYNSLSYPFEFDDLSNIVKYFNVRNLSFKALWCSGSRWICYWLNACYYNIAAAHKKFDPYLYRVGNLIIHLCAGLLVFSLSLLLCRLACHQETFRKAGYLVAFLTAAFFLLHPVQTQTVSYVIQGQLEGMATMFILSIVLCFLVSTTATGTLLRWTSLILMLCLAFIATGCKEIVIVTPVLILLVDWFFVAQGSVTSLKQRWWLHLLLLMIILGMYIYFLKPSYFLTIVGCTMELPNNIGNVLTDSRYEKITVWSFFISQFKVILHYISIFIWPVGLSADYDWKLSRHIFAPDSLGPLAVLCCIAVAILRRLRKDRTDFISFCLLWFFIALLPRSSIIPSTELLADYKTYLASFGILFLGAFLSGKFFVWIEKRAWLPGGWTMVYLLNALLLALLGYAAYRRNLVWESSEAFWADVIKHAPGRARAYNNYGVALCEKGCNKEAIKNFKRAIMLDANYADPYSNLAVSYGALGDYDRAIEALRHAIRIMPTQPEGYNNLASMLMSKGDDAEAGRFLWQAISLRPHYGKAYFNLGKWHLKHHRDEEAWEAFKACCTQADFDNEKGFSMYGNLSMALKKYDDAIFAYTRVLMFNPSHKEVALKRAQMAFEKKDYPQAHAWYLEVRQQHPDWYMPLAQHGELFRVQGDYSKASQLFEEALRIAPRLGVVYSKLVECAEKLGKHERAFQLAQDCLATHPPEDLAREMKAVIKRLKPSH